MNYSADKQPSDRAREPSPSLSPSAFHRRLHGDGGYDLHRFLGAPLLISSDFKSRARPLLNADVAKLQLEHSLSGAGYRISAPD